MRGFLMFLGAGLFTVALGYGAWYISTHFRVVDDRHEPVEHPTDDDNK